MHGIHIPVANGAFNAWDPYGQGAGFPSTVPYPNFAGITQYSTAAVANSNNLTATLQRRFSHGISFQANYTWGHALDEVSNGGIDPYGADNLAGQLNPLSLRANNYGNAAILPTSVLA